MTVSIKVGAELDAAQINQQLADLTRRINGVGTAIAQAGRVRFEPIPRATLEIAQRIEQTMRNMQRISPDLHKRLTAAGQGGAAFDQIDWSRLYGDAAQRHRAQRRMFEMATGLGFGAMPLTPSPGGGMLPGPPGGPLIPGRAPGARPGPLHPIIPGLLGPAGMPGQIGLTAINAGRMGYAAAGGGMRGFGAGLAGGLGAGLGFAAIQGIGALISGVREHVGAAQNEGIGYADLYRRMGGRGSGNHFGALRAQMRGVSDNIAVSYDEVLGLSQMAARRGNLTGQADLAGMVEFGGGFGRSFGFDPSAGVAAFAGLRGVGATRSVDESKRLGLAIAEGIARAGVFAKAEEYLSEIASFGEQAARSGLTRPNMEGFNEALAGLLGARIPGLDVRGAAALLNSADNAIRRGGAAGEAGQAFLYQAIGRRMGLDPMQTEVLQEGGAFATGRGTFGSGLVADYYRRNGIAVPDSAANDDTTLLEMVTDGLRSQYTGGNRRVLAGAAANLLGVNQRQAMALLSLDRQQITGMRGLLSEDQLRGLSATGIQTMGRIANPGASHEELSGIATEFMRRDGNDALSAEERDRLRTAMGSGNTEDLRKVLADLAASRQAEETEGDKTRRTLQGIDKTLTDMADKLVPAMNTARDALLVIAGRNGRASTARSVAGSVRDAEIAEAGDIRRNEEAALTAQHEQATADVRDAMRRGDTAAADAARARLADIEGQMARPAENYEAAVAAARRRFDIRAGEADGRQVTPRERTRPEFDAELRPTAQRVADRLGVPVDYVLGHWSLETHRGRSFAGRNNVGNLTATPNQNATEGGDTDAQGRPIRQRFRNFNSIEEFGDAYISWVQRRAPNARGAQDAAAYARELQRGGYAEAPHFPAALAGEAGRYPRTLPHPASATEALPLPPPAPPAGAAADAEYSRIRAEAAALGVPLPATPGATPLPSDAPPGAVQAAGAAPAVRLEAAPLSGTFTLDMPNGWQASPPPRAEAQTVIRPARPFGATGQ